MTEKELLNKIKQSAEQVEVPESLSPENIEKKCRERKQEKERKKFRIRDPRVIGSLSAAAVFIICCISLRGMDDSKLSGIASGEGVAMDMAATTEAQIVSEYTEEEMDEALPAEGGALEGGSVERKNAGELYTLAESYDAVYERLNELETARDDLAKDAGGAADGAVEEGVMQEDASAFATGVEDMAVESVKREASTDGEKSYSETNVQTFGIDESDIVKTDGEYLYLLRGASVSIVSAGDTMEQVGEVKADTETAAADICAMYVDDDRMVLMVQEYSSSLGQEERSREQKEGGFAVYDIDYIDTDETVSVLTYDISDKKKPVLLGRVTQDGGYVTSRKDGNIVYLFTGKYLLEDYGKNPEDAIPEVNARKVSADCIYMGEQGDRGLIISSVSTSRPGEAKDTVMLLDEGSTIYMGEDSLYLYRMNYRKRMATTEIAKFSLTGGFLNGEAAASVRGVVRDTFAIHEKEEKLRVLTTDMSGKDEENCLFLLDENLKVTGELTHIAVGESIYAARYLGDMAYFITYRNMDPLFAVDLSDEKNPRLVGELEITGFSEYLHFWGEDKLLGLGFETDPKTGEQKGLKLVMFDMSNPTELKILGTKVLQETSYSPALYDYKTILADPKENLIGFVVESYRKGVKRDYEVYRWSGDRFEKILSEKLTDDGYDNANYRGLYIDDNFYIAHPEVVRCYDRADYHLRQTFLPK
ncbi:beta-propeller domain-containing protein [Lachnospiraceae bacterium 38-10]